LLLLAEVLLEGDWEDGDLLRTGLGKEGSVPRELVLRYKQEKELATEGERNAGWNREDLIYWSFV
jgi:hypothetical protein